MIKIILFLLVFSMLNGCERMDSPESKQTLEASYSPEPGSDKTDESLIVFLNQEKNTIFIEQTLPELKTYAAAKQLDLQLRFPEDGIPNEITTLPTLVFQNAKGRHIFAGRYTTFSSIKNFIRGSRLYRPSPSLDCRQKVLRWTKGRATFAAAIKITDLQGAIPANFDPQTFQKQSLQWIHQNSQLFSLGDQVCLQKTDRVFYFDFHPYQGTDGHCFLSLELYSPFSCIDPIYQTAVPLSSKKGWKSVFAQAIQQLEQVLQQQLQQSTIGDALSPISATVAYRSWEELGLALPQASEEERTIERITHFPAQWAFAGPIDEEVPLVQFHFMAPLNRYIGEVRQLGGQLEVDSQGEISGEFEVDTKSLTMGFPDFDKKIHKQYIKAFKYPKSSFRFKGTIDLEGIEAGRPIPLNAEGPFQLMKYQIPLRVSAQLLPYYDQQRQLRLLVEAQYQLRITRDFQIEGPDGPAPANETLLFNLNFLMRPTT